jgi:hypothetical protein
VLSNPTVRNNEVSVREVQDAARAMGQSIYVVNAGSERDFDAAFAEMMQHRVAALCVIADRHPRHIIGPSSAMGPL